MGGAWCPAREGRPNTLSKTLPTFSVEPLILQLMFQALNCMAFVGSAISYSPIPLFDAVL